MTAIEYLIEFQWARDALLLGALVATLCAILSPIIVLKRLAFAGHGVPHAAFAGVGLAIFLGLGAAGFNLVVFVVCLACALIIGAMSHRQRVEHDSAVGIVLVVGMAIGLLLQNVRMHPAVIGWLGMPAYHPGFESVLFGSLWDVSRERLIVAAAVCAAVVVIAGAFFKEIVFYTFDEKVSRTFGVPTTAIHFLIMALLAVTIVLGLRLVGVLLLTALLVIPGTTALLLSSRLSRVLLWSWVIGVAGTLVGLVVSLQFNLYAGPAIAVSLGVIFVVAYGFQAVVRRV
jgi:ABC-type Mn2+/Zn2+ transport system permease subunit